MANVLIKAAPLIPSSKRPLLYGLLALFCLFGLAVAALIYGYVKVTAAVEPLDVPPLSLFQEEEARKKIKLLESTMQKTNRPGFILLTLGELNSYIAAQVAAASEKQTGDSQLLKAQLSLRPDTNVWYCWVRKKWLGLNVPVVWQRTLKLGRAANRWTASVQSMRIGRWEVPPQYWSFCQRTLGGADAALTNLTSWLARLPALEVVTNVAFHSFDLKLYNYPETNVLARYTP